MTEKLLQAAKSGVLCSLVTLVIVGGFILLTGEKLNTDWGSTIGMYILVIGFFYGAFHKREELLAKSHLISLVGAILEAMLLSRVMRVPTETPDLMLWFIMACILLWSLFQASDIFGKDFTDRPRQLLGGTLAACIGWIWVTILIMNFFSSKPTQMFWVYAVGGIAFLLWVVGLPRWNQNRGIESGYVDDCTRREW